MIIMFIQDLHLNVLRSLLTNRLDSLTLGLVLFQLIGVNLFFQKIVTAFSMALPRISHVRNSLHLLQSPKQFGKDGATEAKVMKHVSQTPLYLSC